jgi:hypothetical protein
MIEFDEGAVTMDDEEDFEALCVRLVSEEGALPWSDLDGAIEKLGRQIEGGKWGVWVDPETGEKYSAHFNVDLHLRPMNERVEYH